MTTSRGGGDHDSETQERGQKQSRMAVATEELKVGDPGTLGVLPQASPHQEEIHQSC